MPSQSFATPDQPTAPAVTITWVGQHENIEVLAEGVLLTRIPNPGALRDTGLRGQTPSGDEIEVRLVDTGISQEFQVRRNGLSLLGSKVDVEHAPHGLAGPAPWQAHQTSPATTLETETANRHRKSARVWLYVLGGLSMLVGAVLALVGNSEDVTKELDQQVDTSALQLVGVIAFVIGVVYVLVGVFAKGQRAKLMFTIGAVLTGLSALSSLSVLFRGAGGQGILGIVLQGVACSRCIRARKVS